MTLEGSEAENSRHGSKDVEPPKRSTLLWNGDGIYDVDSYTWTAPYQNRRWQTLSRHQRVASRRKLRQLEQSSSLTRNCIILVQYKSSKIIETLPLSSPNMMEDLDPHLPQRDSMSARRDAGNTGRTASAMCANSSPSTRSLFVFHCV